MGSECLCGHSWAVRLTLGRFILLGAEGPASHQGPSRKRVLTEHTCLLLIHIVFLPDTGTSKQTEINPNLPLSPVHSMLPTDLWTRRLRIQRQRRYPPQTASQCIPSSPEPSVCAAHSCELAPCLPSVARDSPSCSSGAPGVCPQEQLPLQSISGLPSCLPPPLLCPHPPGLDSVSGTSSPG